MGVLTATLVVGVIGLLIGVALVAAGKKFYVEVDERIPRVRDCLPGANCGACGYAGCDAMAAAIVAGTAPVNACPVCSADAVNGIGAVMGVEAAAAEKRVAFVHCSGDCDKSPLKSHYVGIQDCRAAALSGLSARACSYGCLGYGSCEAACGYDAIHVINGVAVVDSSQCVGCGLCAAACPKHLIELLPAQNTMAVRCSSREKGPAVRKACAAGCIGCSLCVRQCEHEAVKIEANLACIDPEKCIGCGKCAEKCPAKVIKPSSQVL